MTQKQAQRVIKLVNINELTEFEGNPRKHSENQISRIVKSLQEYGFTNPVLATKGNMIIAGHARIEAAKRAGYKKIPVIYLDLEGKRAISYNVIDNRLAELVEFDFTALADLLENLNDGEFDMDLTGFNTEELEEIATWSIENSKNVDDVDKGDFWVWVDLENKETYDRIIKGYKGKRSKGRKLDKEKVLRGLLNGKT